MTVISGLNWGRSPSCRSILKYLFQQTQFSLVKWEQEGGCCRARAHVQFIVPCVQLVSCMIASAAALGMEEAGTKRWGCSVTQV